MEMSGTTRTSLHLKFKKALQSTTETTPGEDGIQYALIKNMTENQQSTLLAFYNFVWHSDCLPQQWQTSTLIPILKDGKQATNPKSYRPIALTSCLGKVMEKMVTRRLHLYLEKMKLLDSMQSGFRAYHSATDALARLENYVRTSFLLCHSVVAVFLDIDKAFDTVWHYGLMQKLYKMGLTGNLPKYINNFLTKRSLMVKIGTTTSVKYQTQAGVPQGSVISPLLFSIMIDDIFHECPRTIEYSLYADDGALWITCQHINDGISKMQDALNKIELWSYKWGLNLSVSKTRAVIFTKKNIKQPIPNLKLKNSPIKYVKNIKFLGMHFDRSLTWTIHIQKLLERCQSGLRLMSHISGHSWGADAKTLAKLYIALIRSKLDYGSFLYHTAAPYNLTKIDRVQYAALRIVLGAMKCTPVSLLESEATIIPLKYRRQILGLRYFTKAAAVEGHSVGNMLKDFYLCPFYLARPHPLPITGRVMAELQKIDIELDAISTIKIENKYTMNNNTTRKTLKTVTKQTYTPAQWKALFSDLLDRLYAERNCIYTDGSVRNYKVGAAFFTQDYTWKGRLPDGMSVYTAELYAILKAVQYIKDKKGNYLILTYSLASIESLTHKSATNFLVNQITDEIQQEPIGKIILEWLPSHMGIAGNERADQLAGQACEDQEIITIKLSVDECNKQITSHYYKQWQEEWEKTKWPYKEINPQLKPYAGKTKNRKEQISMSRLRLGVCLFTHGHYATGTSMEVCSLCLVPLTIKHILIQCPVYNLQRETIIQTCNNIKQPCSLETILNELFPVSVIIKFLKDISYYTRI